MCLWRLLGWALSWEKSGGRGRICPYWSQHAKKGPCQGLLSPHPSELSFLLPAGPCSPCKAPDCSKPSMWSRLQQNLTGDAFLKTPLSFRVIYSAPACVQRAGWKGGEADKQRGSKGKATRKSLCSGGLWFFVCENLCMGTIYLFTYIGMNAYAHIFLVEFKFLKIRNELTFFPQNSQWARFIKSERKKKKIWIFQRAVF